MSLTSLAIRFAAPLPKLEQFRRYLFIGPHPDDIEIGAGATAAKLVAAGKEVCFLICTDGRFGDGASGGVTGDALAALRKEESLRSAAVLGVTDVRFLSLCDGGCYGERELKCGIARVVSDFKPDVIFAPDPDTGAECHTDHLNVGNAAKQLACFAPYAGIMAGFGANAAPVKALALYMTAKPNCFVPTKHYMKQQFSAIFACHKSQYPEASPEGNAILLYLKLRAIDFGLRRGRFCAEGFRLLDQTRLHCLPEAGL